MSTEKVELVRRAERGERVRQIRAAAGLSGEALAAEMTRLARSFGMGAAFDGTKISRMESGQRELSAEEAALLTVIDPEGRSVVWLAFGASGGKLARKGATVSGAPRLPLRRPGRGDSSEQKSG